MTGSTVRTFVTIAAVLVFDLSKPWEKSKRGRMGIIAAVIVPHEIT